MEPTEFIWMDGKFFPWMEANVHVLTHTLHYGAGAFEGIRCYNTNKGTAVFRLKEHIERLFYSCDAIQMKLPYTVQEYCEATLELLRKNKLQQGYIRPLCFFGYGVMGLNPLKATVQSMIACWPWGAYLPHEMVDIKTSSYIRIHPDSTVSDAKLCGHYVNSILAANELRGTKYHEALLLDSEGHIAEGPGENLFIVKEGKLYTPKIGTILPGITRDTIMQIAKEKKIEIIETRLVVSDIYEADEAFYTGTAAEVTPIKSLDDKVIGSGEVGSVTESLKKAYLDIVTGKRSEYEHFLSYLS